MAIHCSEEVISVELNAPKVLGSSPLYVQLNSGAQAAVLAGLYLEWVRGTALRGAGRLRRNHQEQRTQQKPAATGPRDLGAAAAAAAFLADAMNAAGGSGGGNSGVEQTLSDLGQSAAGLQGVHSALIDAKPVEVGKAFGTGVFPYALTPPVNAGYASMGSEVQNTLRPLKPWIAGAGYGLSGVSMYLAVTDGYQSGGVQGAATAAAYGAADYYIESGLSAAGPEGMVVAIAFDRIGGSQTVVNAGIEYTATVGCMAVQGSPLPFNYYLYDNTITARKTKLADTVFPKAARVGTW